MNNFLYIDPSLDGLNNHHQSIYIPVIKELLKRGFNVHSVTNKSYKKKSIGEKIINELNYTTDTRISKDFISGWLSDYIQLSDKFAYDLGRLVDINEYKYIYCNSFNAPMIYGLKKFLEVAKEQKKVFPKKIYAEIPLPPGFDINGSNLIPEYKESYLYRHCLSDIDAKDVIFGAFCEDTCLAYKITCNTELLLFPTPRSLNIKLSPEYISFLGYQRKNKGLDLLPSIASYLADNKYNVLIHDAPPGINLLNNLAKQKKSIKYVPKLCNEKEWHELISKSMIIVLPYNPKRYRYSYSSIFVESLFCGVPCIVPSRTSMERTYKNANLNEYLVFDEWKESSIISTFDKLMSRYSQVSKEVQKYSKEWRSKNSPEKFVEFLLN